MQPDAVKVSTLAISPNLVAGDYLPVLRTSATQPEDQDVRVPQEAFNLPANTRLGGLKSVIYLTHAEAVTAGRPSLASLDQIDPLTVCTGTMAYVDLYPGQNSVFLVAVYDNGQDANALRFRGYYDGRFALDTDLSPADGLVPLKWVVLNSAGTTSPVITPGSTTATPIITVFTTTGY